MPLRRDKSRLAAARRVPKKQPNMQLLIMSGVEGPSVYLNGYRISGPKPWGGGKTLATYMINIEDLKKCIAAAEANPA